jgi:5'-3' exonuclease
MYLGIDATNWIHQLWHAHGGRGVMDAALRRVEALIAEFSPSATIACFDRRSFRHGLEPTYKSGRGERDPGLDVVLSEAPAAMAELCTVAVADGYEADDCLATLAWIGRHHGVRTVLASPDKDLRQCLVDQRVGILKSFRTESGKLKDVEWFGAADLRTKYGLEPWQWPDYQALVGDTSDSIKGADGWGEKTASRVLAKMGTLKSCFENPWGCPGISDRQRDALLKFKPRAATVLQLVTLQTDVEAVYDAMR